MAKDNTAKQDTSSVLDISGFDEVNELLHNRKKLFWLNFQTGLVRGAATAIGFAIAIVIIGYLVIIFGGIPVIGDVLHDINSAATPPK